MFLISAFAVEVVYAEGASRCPFPPDWHSPCFATSPGEGEAGGLPG